VKESKYENITKDSAILQISVHKTGTGLAGHSMGGWVGRVGMPTQNFGWVGHNAFGPTQIGLYVR